MLLSHFSEMHCANHHFRVSGCENDRCVTVCAAKWTLNPGREVDSSWQEVQCQDRLPKLGPLQLFAPGGILSKLHPSLTSHQIPNHAATNTASSGVNTLIDTMLSYETRAGQPRRKSLHCSLAKPPGTSRDQTRHASPARHVCMAQRPW